ncbi:MAG: hypothetical protein PHX83_04745 [Acidobacteriia bacterium]|nr:hypothetical protein [Terriglobia bacterium]
MSKTKKPKTHFQQVPLEIVKVIAEQEIPDDKLMGNNVTVKPPQKRKSRRLS